MTDVTNTTATKATFDLSANGAFGTYSGQIETIGDHDWIKVTLTAGQTYNFYSSMHSPGNYRGDTQLSLRDGNGQLIGGLSNDDNGGGGYDSHLSYTPGAGGTFYLDIGEHGDNALGAYTIVMDNGPGNDVYLDDTANTYTAGSGERVEAGAGDDSIDLGAGGYDAFGQVGNDVITGNAVSNYISGGADNDYISGADGNDQLFGDSGDDIVYGGANNDQIHGGSGDDQLFGDAGLDVLIGGSGTDQLTGGTEADMFVFKSIKDSAVGSARDSILDFTHAEGDKIDLHAIDANTKHSGNDAFHWIGTAGFHHKAGELHYQNHVLAGDVNGDGKADFEIHVNSSLHSNDIIV